MEWSGTLLPLLGRGSGWLALALVMSAAAIPIGHRLRVGRRAAPQSATTALHVTLGVATTAAAFTHALFGVFSLGSPRAIGAGNAGLAAGALALLVLMAHVGIGLQLRDPKLRTRQEKRRTHQVTALIISACAIGHIVMFW
jgi:membrane-bound metal-dependent hydrolase YbcI (DUF457 family)